MARTDKALGLAYNRVAQTKRRLHLAIEDRATAKKIARLNSLYERQKLEYKEIKLRVMKI